VARSNLENASVEILTDSTPKPATFPTSECYTVDINDAAAPADSAYRIFLNVSGGARVFRVTSSYLPGEVALQKMPRSQ
jgi:hypothetical protein